MKAETISSERFPKAIGPYSQAVRLGETLYVSGSIPVIPETGKVISEDIQLQVEQTIRNLSCLLKSANATLSNVVKVTLYVKNLENFSSINQVYANYFKEPFPARTCVEVTRLPLDVGIEIDAIAYVPNM